LWGGKKGSEYLLMYFLRNRVYFDNLAGKGRYTRKIEEREMVERNGYMWKENFRQCGGSGFKGVGIGMMWWWAKCDFSRWWWHGTFSSLACEFCTKVSGIFTL
jgi:hypothetical protein